MTKYRLKKNSDFGRIFKSGKKVFSHSLLMLYSGGKRELRVGFSVTKKHGKAVARNRIKRLLRAAFSQLCPSVRKEYHIVFVPKVAEEYSFDSFKNDMFRLFRKEGMLCSQDSRED